MSLPSIKMGLGYDFEPISLIMLVGYDILLKPKIPSFSV